MSETTPRIEVQWRHHFPVIGKPEPYYITTLAEDRTRARDAAIARAVDVLMARYRRETRLRLARRVGVALAVLLGVAWALAVL